MAKRVRIRYKKGAFRELRTLPEIGADCDARGARVCDAANAAGGTYYMESETTGGRGRHRTTVFTGDADTMRAEAKGNGSLLPSLDAGRG